VCGLVVGVDNWVIFKDTDGDEIFPLWSHPDLAQACRFEEHKMMGAKPQVMSLESFVKNYIPNMIAEGVIFGIFYDSTRKGLRLREKHSKQHSRRKLDLCGSSCNPDLVAKWILDES